MVAADPAFSRKCGERGYLGMTWPKDYGGHERSALERYVVIEEMLAVGAPVMAHWIADRQSGPQILRHGSERAKRMILPEIAAGRCYFAIGMSEPDTGSDLAGVKSRASQDRRRLSPQRAQGVDELCARVALPDRAVPQQRPARGTAHRADAVHRRPEGARHHHPADPQRVRRARVQRGDVRRRVRAGRHDGRRRRAGLGHGDVGAGLRALGAGPVSLDLPPAGGSLPGARRRSASGGRRRVRPAHRASGDAAAHVDVDCGDAAEEASRPPRRRRW